jgi:hypothetical protein
MSTAYDYITQTGVVSPDTSDVLTDVQGEWTAAFGDDLDVSVGDSQTPQGMMIAAEVTARTGVVQANAKIANQINPNLAGGLFLDALCALMGLTRAAATSTQVTNVTLTGVINTNIPAGTRATLGQNGPVFVLQTGVVLANDGSGGGIARGVFVAQVPGPTAVAEGALNWPLDSILGWETIVNDNTAVTTMGTNQQSDASLRALRNNTLALQGISTREAQISNLFALPNVTSVSFRENITSATAVIDGITLKAHSIWACVDGGDSLAIATSLLDNKTDGADWNGAVPIGVVDPSSGQTYTVLFDRPTYVFIYGAMTIQQGTFTGNLQQVAAQAVADYFAGNIDGFVGLGNGDTVSPFQISAAVSAACPGCRILGCNIGTVPGSLSPADIAIALNQRAQTTNTAFAITVQS